MKSLGGHASYLSGLTADFGSLRNPRNALCHPTKRVVYILIHIIKYWFQTKLEDSSGSS